MRRYTLGTLVFALTVGFGLTATWLVSGSYWHFGFGESVTPSVAPEAPRHELVSANTSPSREKKNRIFAPEFTDLPNYGDEIVPTDNLIDLWVDDGLYRQSEVVAKNGESWLVLTKKGRGYSLESSTARVKRLSSSSWPGEESDAKLTFKTFGEPIFAIRKIDSVIAGPVPTLYQVGIDEEEVNGEPVPSDEMSDGYLREFIMGLKRYVLRTSQGLTKDGTQVAALVLESGGMMQVVTYTLHSPSDDRDIIGSLHWVGDMDGDGKLDLYIDEFNEKGYTGTNLYLSSHARKGKLVGIAATFGTAGC